MTNLSTNYRLLAPLLAFFSFCLFSPRAPVRGALGAAFLRAARFNAFRSDLSSIFVVFAMFPLGGVFRAVSLQRFIKTKSKRKDCRRKSKAGALACEDNLLVRDSFVH
jgi:hypothetical protein